MQLHQLSLLNYKNFEAQRFVFDPSINCLVGSNGAGKTTVLDAIYYLAFTKGYFNSQSTQNIRHGADLFALEGHFQQSGKQFEVFVGFKKGTKKLVKFNGKPYERISDHIGQIPLVIISPTDRDLISEGSETRRKFIDGIISQSNPEYLSALITYNQALSQRNALLKYFYKNQVFQLPSLELYNELLIENGTFIYNTRSAFLKQFTEHFKKQYKAISASEIEDVSIVYESSLNEVSFKDLLASQLEKDRFAQYSTAGIHKDDLDFLLDGYPIKRFGSQGQQKSFLIALRFAHYEFLKSQSEQKPIVLLDDIFDKLDEHRVSRLIGLVKNNFFGQLFISDTHFNRTEEVVQQTGQSYQMISL